MTIVNNDVTQPWALPRARSHRANGAQFKSAFALTIAKATQKIDRPPASRRDGQPAERLGGRGQKGKGSQENSGKQYQIQGLLGPQANTELYGVARP